MNSTVASNPKIIMSKCQQSPGTPKQAVREAAPAEETLSRARKQLPAPRRPEKGELGPSPGSRARRGEGARKAGIGSGGAEERARARRPCPRLPDNAASSSSPRTASAGSTASGGSQKSSQHVPGDGRIPPGGQLRAAQRRDETCGSLSSESSGNAAGPRRRPGAAAACAREPGGPAPPRRHRPARALSRPSRLRGPPGSSPSHPGGCGEEPTLRLRIVLTTALTRDCEALGLSCQSFSESYPRKAKALQQPFI